MLLSLLYVTAVIRRLFAAPLREPRYHVCFTGRFLLCFTIVTRLPPHTSRYLCLRNMRRHCHVAA